MEERQQAAQAGGIARPPTGHEVRSDFLFRKMCWTLAIAAVALVVGIIFVIGRSAAPTGSKAQIGVYRPIEAGLAGGRADGLAFGPAGSFKLGTVLRVEDDKALIFVGQDRFDAELAHRILRKRIDAPTADELRKLLLIEKIRSMSSEELKREKLDDLKIEDITRMAPNLLQERFGRIRFALVEAGTENLEVGEDVRIKLTAALDDPASKLLIERKFVCELLGGAKTQLGGGAGVSSESSIRDALVVRAGADESLLLVAPGEQQESIVQGLSVSERESISLEQLETKLLENVLDDLRPIRAASLELGGMSRADIVKLAADDPEAYKKLVEDNRQMLLSDRRAALLDLTQWSLISVATGEVHPALVTDGRVEVSLIGLPVSGVNILTATSWDATRDVYGLLPQIWGTLYSSTLALIIASALGVSIAIVLSQEFLPHRLEIVVKNIVDLLAAIPSVVYGLWGIFVLIPFLRWLIGLAIPNFTLSQSLLPATLVLSIMILPTIAAISRDALVSVNPRIKEAAYGVGCTRWEAILFILLPTASNGILAAIVLGFGRALGETMALAMLFGNRNELNFGLTEPGNTLAALIANNMPEAGHNQIQVLMLAGLVLLGITLAVNMLGAGIIQYANRGRQGVRQ